MVPQLILLLAYLGATADGATVTLTEPGQSDYFPWPASGQFRVLLPCETNSKLNFEIRRKDGTAVQWYMGGNELNMQEGIANVISRDDLPHPDCGERTEIVHKVQWIRTTGEVTVEFDETVIRLKGTGEGVDPGRVTWSLHITKGGYITVTDNGK